MKVRLTLFAVVVLLVVVSAYAHHPFADEYDWKKPVTLTGTVTKLEWMNPHSNLYVDAKDDNGNMRHWTLELGSTGALASAGWTRTMIKAGDMITVEGWLAKDKPDHANVKSVKLSNNRELSGGSSITQIKRGTEKNKPISN